MERQTYKKTNTRMLKRDDDFDANAQEIHHRLLIQLFPLQTSF